MDVEQTQEKGAEFAGTSQGKQKFRGKLYALTESSAWEDQGVGVISITGSGSTRRLIFRDESSEEAMHDRPVFAPDVYQLQGEGEKQTIIVWEDQEDQKDWALSFQDPEGTAEIWDLLRGESADTKRLLPLPKFANLQEICRKLQFVPPSQREAFAQECASAKFVAELRETFRQAEDLASDETLGFLFHITKGVFLLSSQKLTERYLRRDMYEDVLGMLEFDETVPREKRIPHRQVLKNEVQFNSVLPFEEEETVERIHLNYRLIYLKDIVLPRNLDDAAFASLVGMIHANFAVILDQLMKSGPLMDKLLDQLRQKDMHALLFLQEACRIARTIPPTQRQALYDKMVERGLFDALGLFLGDAPDAMAVVDGVSTPKEHPARYHAVEVLLLHAQPDVGPLRQHVTAEGSENGRALLSQLVRLMLTDEDQGLQGQISEVIRSIMDPTALEHKERDGRLDVFYERGVLDDIVAPLRAVSGHQAQDYFAQQLICELLAFAVAKHAYRAKVYVIRQGVAQHLSRLLVAPQRFLQLAALRLLRAIVATKDENYHRYLITNRCFVPLMHSFEQSLAPPTLGSNLVVSATLDLLEFIRTDNLKILVEHICKMHGALLQEHGPRIKTLSALLLKYQQNLEYEAFPPQAVTGGPVVSENRRQPRRTRSPGRDDSGEDESYFESLEEDADEEGPGTTGRGNSPGADQGSPTSPKSLKGLLGTYDEDDDESEAKADMPEPEQEVSQAALSRVRSFNSQASDAGVPDPGPTFETKEETPDPEADPHHAEGEASVTEAEAETEATSDKPLGHAPKRQKTAPAEDDL